MIIEQVRNKIEEFGELNGKEASFSNENLGHIFKLLAESYSDVYGSIIREYTCNAIDSHTEAGVEKDVEVFLGYKDGNYQLIFTDWGVGLSPERMDKFISYGDSTKRDSNDLIGGLGIGSKSAFAYTDSFYIRTVFENREYLYLMHKGISIPRLELISEDIIEEHNGSQFIIYINSYDLTKFNNAIIKNLTFFKNVTIRTTSYTESLIADYKYFKISSVISSPHILINDVIYPLNQKFIEHYKTLDVFTENKFYDIPPLCLKFNIGDFQPNLTREDILYTDDATEKLVDKLTLALAEFQEVIIKNQKQFETDSYAVHLNNVKCTSIILHGFSVPMKQEWSKEYTPFKEIGFNTKRGSGHGETSNFRYVYPKKEIKKGRRTITTSHDKNIIVGQYKVLDKYEKRYYADYNEVYVDKLYYKYFRKYLWKCLPKTFMGKIHWINDIFDKLRKEYKLEYFEELSLEQINEYKEEDKLHKLEFGVVPANTKILYRTRYNSPQELTYDADIRYIYSFENDIFDLLDVIAKIKYKDNSFNSKWITKNKKQVYRKKKYEFIKLNQTNLDKCIRKKIPLFDVEWFLEQEPDLIRYMTSLYVLKKNYYDVNTEDYDKFYNSHIRFNRNKSLLKEEKHILESYNTRVMCKFYRGDIGNLNYDFIKKELSHRFMSLDKNIGVENYNYKRNDLLSALNTYSYQSYLSIFEQYHDFKYLRECVKKVNYNMIKVPKKFKIFSYFSSQSPVRFVAKNIKHLRKIKYSELISNFKKERF